MAEIRPFMGVRYNQAKINNLAQVLCPPYDIISPEFQDQLYQTSDYNFIRIEYNKETSQDNNQNNRYTRAASFLAKWMQEGILMRDAKPAFYLHEHRFVCQGKSCCRQNIIAAVKLEDWSKKIVLPHENIIPKAKSDRMSMLQVCQTNTSPVLAMYADPKRIIFATLKKQAQEKPVIDFTDLWGDGHRVWTVVQPEAISAIQQEMAKHPLYIADGHHRYDSALTYKKERESQNPNFSGEEGFNFVMISLVDFADPGMVILPTHRLIRGIPASDIGRLSMRLPVFFEIEKIPLESPDLWQKVDGLLTGIRPDSSKTRMGIVGLEKDVLSILTLRDFQAISRFMPGAHGDLYKKLDVSLVDHVILDQILAFDKDKVEGNIIYSHDRLEVIRQIKEGQYQLGFIMNPVRPELIKAIADANDRMPRKSTYFYPKSPAGLVFYKW